MRGAAAVIIAITMVVGPDPISSCRQNISPKNVEPEADENVQISLSNLRNGVTCKTMHIALRDRRNGYRIDSLEFVRAVDLLLRIHGRIDMSSVPTLIQGEQEEATPLARRDQP